MWKKLFRVRKKQTAVMLFIIALCSALLTASSAILFSMDAPYEKLADETDAADMIIYLADPSKEGAESVAKDMEKLSGIQKSLLVKRHSINEECYVGKKNIDGFLSLKAYDPDVFGKIRYLGESQKTAAELEEGECMIPACVFYENDIKIGESFRIKTQEGEFRYKIVGVFAGIYDSSLAFDSSILVKEIPGRLSGEFLLYIYTEDGYETSELMLAYEEAYGHALPGNPFSKASRVFSAQLANKILGVILCVLGVIMLLVSCVIIAFMIKNALMVDAKNIAVYKTIGYEAGDIGRMYLCFYVFLAMTASLVGIVTAKFYADHLMNEMFSSIIEKADLNLLAIGWPGFVLIVGIVFLTVSAAVRKTRNIKPVYALHGLRTVNTKKRTETKAVHGFSPWNMALRMILRNPKGICGILITAAVSVAGMNLGMISLDVAEHLKEDNDYWMGIDKSDLVVNLSEDADMEELLLKMEKEPEIARMVQASYSGKMLFLEWQDRMEENVIYPFVYEEYQLPGLDCQSGSNPEKENEIAITKKIADVTKKEIGDYLKVNVDGTEKNYLITGIFQTYYNMGANCRLSSDGYKGTARILRYDTLSVYLKKGVDLEKTVEKYKEKFGGYGKVLKRTEQFSTIMNMIMDPQKSAIPPLILILLFIGAANIFCIVLLKNTREERMNGIYKSIGYSSGHLLLANIIYVAFLALATMAAAVPVTLFIYPKVMRTALSMFGLLKYEVSYQVVHLVIMNSLIFGLFLLSTILSSGSIKKIRVRQLVVE